MDIVITEQGSPSNPYLDRVKLVQGDITAQDADAIVTMIPHTLEYHGEINMALLKAAGTQLDHFLLENIYKARAGDVYAVPGFNMACGHIFFCVVPYWKDDFDRHDKYLVNSARKAMETARAMNLRTLAFPPLASGKHGYPKPRAARLMMQGIADRLDETVEEIRIVCRSETTLEIFRERLIQLGWKA
jgi:O-acetyl-ADP-ribose deacetylase (regulator of RNase III)